MPRSLSQLIASLPLETHSLTASILQSPSPAIKVSLRCSSILSFSSITAAIPPWAYQVELSTREFFEIKVTSKFLDSSIAAVIPAAPLPMMSTSVLINFFEN